MNKLLYDEQKSSTNIGLESKERRALHFHKKF
jgi:hypothetical protein